MNDTAAHDRRVTHPLPSAVLGWMLLTGSALIALWGSFFLFECITDAALLGTGLCCPRGRRLTRPAAFVVVTRLP